MLLARPQFLNQDPPRPQQLFLPDFPMVPHAGHAGMIVAVVSVESVFVCDIVKTKSEKSANNDYVV